MNNKLDILRHTQLNMHDPENGIYGDCWRTTVACLLRLPIEEVPHVCDGPDDGKAGERMRAFLESRNCALIQIPYSGDLSLEQLLDYVGAISVSGGLHWCLMGTSRTGCNHVVICKGDQIVHDPSITQSGIVGPSSDGLWWAEWIVERAPCDRIANPSPVSETAASFQNRVQPWMMACFGEKIAGDREERNHRFLEEALELVQSTGCTAHEAHQLVDYVYGRPIGEPHQEVGGVMVTLAALCLANALDMHEAGETELARVWTKVEAIRAKQAAKPKHSPLPGPSACSIADPSTRDCQNMKEVGGGMDGERYRCDVCGKGYFLDYEDMK